MRKITKKYTHYFDSRVYAIFYKNSNTIYYNLDCRKGAKLVITKGNTQEGLAYEKV